MNWENYYIIKSFKMIRLKNIQQIIFRKQHKEVPEKVSLKFCTRLNICQDLGQDKQLSGAEASSLSFYLYELEKKLQTFQLSRKVRQFTHVHIPSTVLSLRERKNRHFKITCINNVGISMQVIIFECLLHLLDLALTRSRTYVCSTYPDGGARGLNRRVAKLQE